MHRKKPMHPSEAVGTSAQPSRLCVLVVDDDPVLRLFHAELLSEAGFEVDTAEDGEAGLDALHFKRYDLLVTDNDMPKISGLELIRIIRTVDKTLPIIMVSGAIPIEELQREPQLRLAGTLSKPVTAQDLVRTVAATLDIALRAERATAGTRPLTGPSHALAA